jgi:hypothetical protein
MFGIVSRRTRERNFYAAGMQEVSMRSLPPRSTNPCFSKSAMSCRILRGISKVSSEKQNFKALPGSLRNSRSTGWTHCHAGKPFTVRLRSSAQTKELPSICRTVVPRLRDTRGSAIDSVKERGSHGALRSQLPATDSQPTRSRPRSVCQLLPRKPVSPYFG